MIRLKKIYILLVAASLVAATSCKKDDPEVPANTTNITFTSSLEIPEPDGDLAKNYLSMERYIYWENTDIVSVFSAVGEADDTDPAPSLVQDVSARVRADQRYADINCSGIAETGVYYGIFPAASRVGSTPLQIKVLDKYTYRTDGNADLSFPRPGIPMVAYEEPAGDAPQLNFHSLCGLLRFQLTASNDAQATIDRICITDLSVGPSDFATPITGVFDIIDYDTYSPYLEFNDAWEKNSSIWINDINQTVGPDHLLTFYVPLPARNSSGDPVAYHLLVRVMNTSGEVFYREIRSVNIRRNCMSFLRALEITKWMKNASDKPGSDIGMVGCGTELRPYQIYDAEDLAKLRDAFAAGTPVINGQEVSSNTVFRVVRSDIQLTTSNWTSGIQNFTGKFTYETTSGVKSIVNNSNAPIFTSVSASGSVEGVSVNRTSASYTGSSDFSPLCGTNLGTIDNCAFSGSLSATNASLAGLCVDNQGSITNGAVTGSITTGGEAAGICLVNQSGAIIEGYAISNAVITGVEAAGICHENSGIVRNAQVTYSRSNVSNPYGGIVYLNNSGGEISNCQVYGTLSSSSSIGGICHSNDGIVDNCRNGLDELHGENRTGGIVAEQNGMHAEIRNCCNIGVTTANVDGGSRDAGGIVAYINGGEVNNCYCTLEVESSGASQYGAIAGNVHAGTIQNCYNGSSMAPFYGGEAAGHSIGVNCFNHSALDGCCVYNHSTGAIVSLTSGSNGSVGGDMYAALNAWVSNNGSEYLNWTSAANPTFVSKKSSRHNRR